MSVSASLIAMIAANGAVPASTDAWTISSDGLRCAVSRKFDSGKTHAMLILSPDLTTSQTNGVISLANVDSSKARVTRFTLSTSQVDAMLVSNQLTIPDERSVASLSVEGVGPALQNATTCRAKLRDRWNIDQSAVAGIATPPEPVNGPNWLQPWYFPNVGRLSAKVNDMTFLLAVAKDGRIDSCQTIASSGPASITDAACQSAKQNGQFKPARDVSGRAVGSWSVQRLVWRDPRYHEPDPKLLNPPPASLSSPISHTYVTPPAPPSQR